MKRQFLFLVIILLTAVSIYGQIGFTGPVTGLNARGHRQSVTVADAKKLREDSKVIIQGNIVGSLGNERYLFKDNTGEITVEIDYEVWNGLSVDENDRVEIYGEIDIERGKKEVDAKFIKVIDS